MRFGLGKRVYRSISGICRSCFALTLGLCMGILPALPAGCGYITVRAEQAQTAGGTGSESVDYSVSDSATAKPAAASQQEHGPGVEIIIMPADVPIIIFPVI